MSGLDPDPIVTVEGALTQLARWAAVPRLHERVAAEAGVDLERGAYAVLARIGDQGPIRVSDCAHRMVLDVSTLSRHVQRLERAGLIRRTADLRDRRAVALTLTSSGRRALEKLRAARQALLVEVLADWSHEDRADLARLLRRLAESPMRLIEGPEERARA